MGQGIKKAGDPVSWTKVLGVHTGEMCYLLHNLEGGH